MTEPNRYGAQAIRNEAGEQCCCHMVSLSDICDGCEALRSTKRKPMLVGVEGTAYMTSTGYAMMLEDDEDDVRSRAEDELAEEPEDE